MKRATAPRMPVPCAECGQPVPQPQGRGRTRVRCPGECAAKAQARNLYVFRCGSPEEKEAHALRSHIVNTRASRLRHLEVLNDRIARTELAKHNSQRTLATLTAQRDALALEIAKESKP